jgi:hypothetical protein
MTRKVYRTAQGKMVDIGALQLRNENVRAVGNMPVNARGDLIDSNNRSIEARNQQVAKNYRRQTTNVSNGTVFTAEESESESSAIRPSKAKKQVAAPNASEIPAEKNLETSAKPLTGLAGAIAKARQIKQEEMANPHQVAAFQRKTTEK